MNKSIILNSDSYKLTHFNQYPENTTSVYSYIESRISENILMYPKTLFFGLQMFLKEYLSKPITMDDVDFGEIIAKKHINGVKFNRKGWEYIVQQHGGNLPIVIKAVAEGSLVDRGNVLVTIENTDPACYWLPSYVETSLLRAIWYPNSVATISFYIKKMLKEYLEATSDDISGLEFMLHDFGSRGVSSFESAGIGGLAHLVNFRGTDTITSLLYGREFYGADMPAYSVDATEHSVMTIKGREGELEQCQRILDVFLKPGKIVSVVSDSYDIYNCCENIWGGVLKEQIENSGGKLVVRPDSGIPHEVVPKIMEILGNKFGYTINSKGYKILPPYIGVIQGDGVEHESIGRILHELETRKWAISNMVFGMGGALLQKVNRDTFNFAQKASFAIVEGKNVEVYKSPVGDSTKKSKRGKLALLNNDGKYSTIPIEGNNHMFDCLDVVYRNGIIIKECSLDDVRERANKSLYI